MSDEIKYCSYPVVDLDKIKFDCFLTTRGSTPICMSGSHALLSYAGHKPRCIYGLDVFTIAQMRAKYNDPEDCWYQDQSIAG